MCGARGHRNGKTRTSLSTTTMLQLTGPLKFRSFWPRTTWQWSPIPHTHPIWPPVTFSSSPSWSFGWRVEDSTPLKRFKRNRSGYLTQFQKGTSRDASKRGRNNGTAVFVQKGSTLKVMEKFNIQGKQTSFYKYCPGTFGYTLVLQLQEVAIQLSTKTEMLHKTKYFHNMALLKVLCTHEFTDTCEPSIHLPSATQRFLPVCYMTSLTF